MPLQGALVETPSRSALKGTLVERTYREALVEAPPLMNTPFRKALNPKPLNPKP